MVEAVMAVFSSAMGQRRARRPVVIGLCGAQGSGKSTLAAAIAEAGVSAGLRIAVLSLDDLYLTRAQRQSLAREVHPLLATRGVPGTHDIALGMAVLDDLQKGLPVRLPRFDKARDDRCLPAEWPLSPAHCDVILFEGWCVGARPQSAASLAKPVNALEALEDSACIWRTYVNSALAGGYQALFARLDRLILLEAPDFQVIHGWRLEQERELAMRSPQSDHLMDEPAIARFIAHFERLTRHILKEMPHRADLLIHLDRQRCVTAIEPRRL